MRKVTGFAIEEPGINYVESVMLLRQEYQTGSRRNAETVIELLGQQAEGLRRLSQLHDSESLFRTTLQISRQEGILWGEGWALWGLGSVLRARGAYTRSALAFEAALSVAKRASDRRCALWSIAELSELDRIAGRHLRAIAIHRKLLDEFRSIGDWKGVCWASLGIAQMFRLRREFDSAKAEFMRSQEVSSMIGNSVGAAWAVRGLAEIARESGDSSLAIKLATTARDDFSFIGYRLGAAYALKTQADSLILAGRIDEAQSTATQCQDEFLLCGESRGIGFSLLTLGMAWSRMDEPTQAIPLLQRSRVLLSSVGGCEPGGFSPTIELANVVSRLGKRVSYLVSRTQEHQGRTLHSRGTPQKRGAPQFERYASDSATSRS